jgi:hypothetical protein
MRSLEECYITNMVMQNGQTVPSFSNLIKKKNVFFRTRVEVIQNPNDEDIVVFGGGDKN